MMILLRFSKFSRLLLYFLEYNPVNLISLVRIKDQTVFCFILFFLLTACKNPSLRDDTNSEDWSIFRGNPSLSGYTNVSLPNNPQLLWTFKSDSYTKSSPVVYNRVVYWSNRRGRIFGVNIEGKQVFDYAMETAVDAIPMIHDSVLYIGRIDGYL